MDRETKSLPVKLTPEELAVRADELAVKVRELEEHETAKKEAARQMKDEQDRIEFAVSRLARIVRERSEDRDVDCEWQRNDARRTMDLVREDTGAVVEYRQMTTQELNLPLPFPREA